MLLVTSKKCEIERTLNALYNLKYTFFRRPVMYLIINCSAVLKGLPQKFDLTFVSQGQCLSTMKSKRLSEY